MNLFNICVYLCSSVVLKDLTDEGARSVAVTETFLRCSAAVAVGVVAALIFTFKSRKKSNAPRRGASVMPPPGMPPRSRQAPPSGTYGTSASSGNLATTQAAVGATGTSAAVNRQAGGRAA